MDEVYPIMKKTIRKAMDQFLMLKSTGKRNGSNIMNEMNAIVNANGLTGSAGGLNASRSGSGVNGLSRSGNGRSSGGAASG